MVQLQYWRLVVCVAIAKGALSWRVERESKLKSLQQQQQRRRVNMTQPNRASSRPLLFSEPTFSDKFPKKFLSSKLLHRRPSRRALLRCRGLLHTVSIREIANHDSVQTYSFHTKEKLSRDAAVQYTLQRPLTSAV